ncbi:MULTISPECIES: carbohydrate kinase [unclassified Isoptericola]|uniref:carbohydrate kinase family protein n=1 Tax=unclassified Isoptericola TaxID=2623355 RepID=UPI002712E317|nr:MULTISPECIES: carbohydrate kinase [unclassified Isoptericola]MDO8144278.1 carbohydrate kinase [Isoptericola sp. 178]MDO8148132.1 carbohydrate kinase [Isoptericola sp. b515]MDO8151609.1 carbohydrate kinase [Isoptericola sp. b408]
MTSHVLAVGEALVDVVERPDGTRTEHPGGSLANVALTLGRLGRDARLATWIGRDDRGETVRSWLAASGVTVTPGSDAATRTSVARATLDAAGTATYDFDLEWRVPAGTRADAGTLAVHTGSIGAVLEPGAADVRAVVEAARATSTITYDPNARPVLMGDAASARERVESFVRLADVVKVSDEDLAWLAPETAPLDVARGWVHELGAALVVVTFGGEGSTAVTATGEVHVPSRPVQVVDTVGAGDSFMGALLDGLWSADLLGADRREALATIDHATVERLLSRCAAVAAVTVSRAGANPPWIDDLEDA